MTSPRNCARFRRDLNICFLFPCRSLMSGKPACAWHLHVPLRPKFVVSQGFYASMRHCRPFCIGLNCALGASQMRPFLQRMAKVAECFVLVYANAGLPNAMGEYDDTPEDMARDNYVFAEEGLINMVGGCCGSTPKHIEVRQLSHPWLGFPCVN